jgi:hypothetical protein
VTTLHVFESDSVRRDVYVLCGHTVINTPSQTDDVCVVFICNLWSKYQRVLTQLVKITSCNRKAAGSSPSEIQLSVVGVSAR